MKKLDVCTACEIIGYAILSPEQVKSSSLSGCGLIRPLQCSTSSSILLLIAVIEMAVQEVGRFQ